VNQFFLALFIIGGGISRRWLGKVDFDVGFGGLGWVLVG